MRGDVVSRLSGAVYFFVSEPIWGLLNDPGPHGQDRLRFLSAPRYSDAIAASPVILGRPCPLHRGQVTSRKATRMETSGSRGFTRRSRSTTVSQLSQATTGLDALVIVGSGILLGHCQNLHRSLRLDKHEPRRIQV